MNSKELLVFATLADVFGNLAEATVKGTKLSPEELHKLAELAPKFKELSAQFVEKAKNVESTLDKVDARIDNVFEAVLVKTLEMLEKDL